MITESKISGKEPYFHRHSPFDATVDKILEILGTSPDNIEAYLSSHKRYTRLTANSLSFLRVFFGGQAIRNYENAREKGNKIVMAAQIVALGLLIASDGVDGYLTRKAHIDDNELGKQIDSISDAALRFMLSRSSLMPDTDIIDKILTGSRNCINSCMLNGSNKRKIFQY